MPPATRPDRGGCRIGAILGGADDRAAGLLWSTPGRRFHLADRSQRARVYEIVLREGGSEDILTYVDGAPLVDLWEDLVLPRDIRAAWDPLIQSATRAAA